MSKIAISAVVFDYGNVLSLDQNAVGLARLVSLTGLSADEFKRRYWKSRADYDRGVLTGAQYWSSILGSPDEASTELIDELVQTDVESWLDLNDTSVEWVEELRTNGVTLGLLSNMPFDVLSGLTKRHVALLSNFSATLFSCSVQTVKPEARIYEELLKALRLPGAQVLFVDDVEANVRGAVDAGLHSIRFESLLKAREDTQRQFSLVRTNSEQNGG